MGSLEIDDAALAYLCENGYSSDLGARPLNRLIQNEILNKLAVFLLKGQIKDKEAARIRLGPKGLEILPNHEIEDVEMADVEVNDWQDSDDDDSEIESTPL